MNGSLLLERYRWPLRANSAPLLLTLILCSGCMTNTRGQAQKTMVDPCVHYDYIYPSDQDTKDTRDQVAIHNIAHETICEEAK